MKSFYYLAISIAFCFIGWDAQATCQAQVRVPRRPVVPGELSQDAKNRLKRITKKRIDDAMNAELVKVRRDSAGSGMLVGIIKNNQIIHLEAYGFLNEQDRTPMTLETQLSWASISKVITAVVAWQQIADTNIQLGLNTRTSEVLNYWSARGNTDRSNKARVTVDQLLTHRSGVGHYTSSPENRDINNSQWSDSYRRVRTITPVDWNARQSVAYYKDKAIGAGNNGRFEYTTFGTCVLAAMLDQKARESSNGRQNYTSWVQEKIVQPSGMSELLIAKKFRHNLPGAGWRSTVADLTKFMHALMNDRLVPMSQLTQTIEPGNASGAYYGRGVYRRSIGGRVYLGHRGSQAGTRTSMLMLANRRDVRQRNGTISSVYELDPEKFGVVIMINDKAASVNMDAIMTAAYEATH